MNTFLPNVEHEGQLRACSVLTVGALLPADLGLQTAQVNIFGRARIVVHLSTCRAQVSCVVFVETQFGYRCGLNFVLWSNGDPMGMGGLLGPPWCGQGHRIETQTVSHVWFKNAVQRSQSTKGPRHRQWMWCPARPAQYVTVAIKDSPSIIMWRGSSFVCGLQTARTAVSEPAGPRLKLRGLASSVPLC